MPTSDKEPQKASDDLNAVPVAETRKDADVGSSSQPLYGVVAILDALGAAAYSREEANEFLKAREEVKAALVKTASEGLRIEKEDLTVFTFNDSIILTYVGKSGVTAAFIASNRPQSRRALPAIGKSMRKWPPSRIRSNWRRYSAWANPLIGSGVGSPIDPMSCVFTASWNI
jgi:hypothetical protein